MATLASNHSLHGTRSEYQPPRPLVRANDVPSNGGGNAGSNEAGNEPTARAVYQPSRRSGPVAGLASAAVILAAMAALATLNVVAQHKAAQRLTVVAMRELKTTPPPPPPAKLEKPQVVPPQAFMPKPMMQLPAPGPTQVALDASPPPAPAMVAAPKDAAPAGPVQAVPPPSSDPVEGGDLSSQVLSAKPPVYPLDARRRREQGTVKLLVLVGPDGRVSDIQLAGSSGSQLLDRAALGAVKHWRWSPQKKGGAPVAVRGYVTIPFVLTR
jgi:protein TonB